MQSKRNSFAPCIKLLIVCLRSELSKIRQIISRHTVLNWEQSGDIGLLPIADNFRSGELGQIRHRTLQKDVLRRIDDVAPPSLAIRVIVVGHIKGPFSNTKGVLRVFHEAATHREFDQMLPAILQGASLDWHALISNNLRHYSGPPQIDRWLEQFMICDRLWVGQALLQLLDFWPDHKICEALFESSEEPPIFKNGDWLNLYDLVIYNDPSKGKSSAVISRYVKQKWGVQDKIISLPNALLLQRAKRRILFFEDCIMTGTECMGLFDDGKLDGLLASSNIDFKFAVGTQYGIYRFETFIKRAHMDDKVSIIKPAIGYIRNVTEAGVQAFTGDRLFNASCEVIDPGKYLINGINLRGAKHFNASQRSHIIHFCRDIGTQLMFNRFQRLGHEGEIASEMASEHCLGFGNLGLLVAFAHGLPDNLVPLFRHGGKVFYNGKHIEWVPLFKPIGS